MIGVLPEDDGFRAVERRQLQRAQAAAARGIDARAGVLPRLEESAQPPGLPRRQGRGQCRPPAFRNGLARHALSQILPPGRTPSVQSPFAAKALTAPRMSLSIPAIWLSISTKKISPKACSLPA